MRRAYAGKARAQRKGQTSRRATSSRRGRNCPADCGVARAAGRTGDFDDLYSHAGRSGTLSTSRGHAGTLRPRPTPPTRSSFILNKPTIPSSAQVQSELGCRLLALEPNTEPAPLCVRCADRHAGLGTLKHRVLIHSARRDRRLPQLGFVNIPFVLNGPSRSRRARAVLHAARRRYRQRDAALWELRRRWDGYQRLR